MTLQNEKDGKDHWDFLGENQKFGLTYIDKQSLVYPTERLWLDRNFRYCDMHSTCKASVNLVFQKSKIKFYKKNITKRS